MMAGRGTSPRDAAGGPARHIPVLLDEVVAALDPRDGGIYVDGTFGAGGYSAALLDAADCRVIAIDRDPAAISAGRAMAAASGGRLTLVEGRFSQLDAIAAEAGASVADGVTLDVGVSSMQLDDAERGFSFMRDAPLDMRMGGEGASAADVVNEFAETDIARILRILGEERRARAIARAVVAARPVTTTGELAEIVSRVLGPSRDGKHPATRTFQALRIFVNEELDELAGGLGAAERVLGPGGRLAVVSFHSLEDRLVKRFLTDRAGGRGVSRHMPKAEGPAPTFRLLSRQGTAPSDAEIAANARARSARMRAAERTGAPVREGDPRALGVPTITPARRPQ